MTREELNKMTVLGLRKLAKENKVKLSAGISKAEIVERIAAAFGVEETASVSASEGTAAAAPDQGKAAVSAKEEPAVSAEAAPAPDAQDDENSGEDEPVTEDDEDEDDIVPDPPKVSAPVSRPLAPQPAQPLQFRAAWHNPSPQRPNTRPAPQHMTPGWQTGNRPMQQQDSMPHLGTVKPAGFTPRFGPSAAPEQPVQQPVPESRGYGYRPADPAPRRSYTEAPRPAYTEQRAPAPQSSYAAPAPRNDYAPQQPANPYEPEEANGYNPSINELITPADCTEAAGFLDIHADGYGFLRVTGMLPSARDIYVPAPLIRRFSLRVGDRVGGKVRPQREGDKYAALLYVTTVNDAEVTSAPVRRSFEELTPVYSNRRIALSSAASMRTVDLVAPIGYGQRILMVTPPDCGKVGLMRDFVLSLEQSDPEALVMTMLLDECPEDVTLFRDQVHSPVYAATFDQAPENHLRLTEMVLEHAMRQVEMKKNVVLIVDSLTQLAKTYTVAAAQTGRAVPGMVNPSSLFRAKRLFGAARCTREAGTLTVLGIMDADNGSKVDDAVIAEFRDTANCTLVLDTTIARSGILPALHVQRCGTKNADMLTTPAQKQGMKLLQSVIASLSPVQAAQQVQDLLSKTSDNDDLFTRLKDWVAVLKQ